MTAPNTAYFNNDTTNLILHKVAVATRTVKFPLLAAAYPTPAEFKTKFFCDYMFEALSKKDGSDNVVKVLIAGILEGSNNSFMHAENRLSNLVVSKKDSGGSIVKVIILNDGGLNTLNWTEGENVLSTKIFDLRISTDFKTSFYQGSSQYGFRGRQQNVDGTAWESWQVEYANLEHGNIAANSGLSIPNLGFGTDRKGMQYQIQPFITNSEGTFYGAILEIFPTAQQILFFGFTDYMYIDTPTVGVGTKLYQNENFGGYIQTSGDYPTDSRYYWRYRYDVFENAYFFTERVDTNPGGGGPDPTEPSRIDYAGYSTSSQTDANNQVLGGANQNTGTLWVSPDDNRFYLTWSGTYPNFTFSNLAQDGYYASGNVAGVTLELHLINGEEQ